MGVEQFIYQHLRRPAIELAPPISSDLSSFENVDWITFGSSTAAATAADANKRAQLVLIGGCELLQLSSLLSTNCAEFVNTVRDDRGVRFDDAGFISTDRFVIARDRAFTDLEYWTFDDSARFDTAVNRSQMVLAALFHATDWNYFESDTGTLVRLDKARLERVLRERGVWFVRNFRPLRMTIGERFDLVARALDRIAEMAPKDAPLFTFGVNTKGIREKGPGKVLRQYTNGKLTREKLLAGNRIGSQTVLRSCYNEYIRKYCETSPRFRFVDVDNLVSLEDVIGREKDGSFLPDHLSRRAYMAIAAHINLSVSSDTSERRDVA